MYVRLKQIASNLLDVLVVLDFSLDISRNGICGKLFILN